MPITFPLSLFFFFLLLLHAHPSSSASSSSNSSDLLSSLLAFKASLLDPRRALSSWNPSSPPCSGSWIGVKCISGHVVGLHLPSKGLSGSLSPDVAHLSSLRQLSLHDNAISGPIPSSISALRNLRGLYLFNNLFTGSIPSPLSPVLQALDLRKNLLSGAIPAQLASSSALLRRIDLSSNRLSSSIPPSLASLSRLQILVLSHNQLLGPIPSQLSQLPYLRILDLSHNLLNGSFDVAVGAASLEQQQFFLSLSTLNLSHNDLTGPLPARIGELRSLNNLALSDNAFVGPVPQELGNLTGLNSLDISHNDFTGILPASLGKLLNLTSFNCSYNNLTGQVPKLSRRFDASAFAGNPGLCGFSASSLCAPATAPGPAVASSNGGQTEATAEPGGRKGRKFSALAMVFIIVGVLIVLLLVMCLCSVVFLCCCRKSDVSKAGFMMGDQKAKGTSYASSGTGGAKKKKKTCGGAELGTGKLVHFEGSLGFAADDLLCATAEVLGKSTYGTVYKATLDDGNQVAVKRLREGIVKSQKDFEAEVAVLGAIRHDNLLPLRAYYWGPKDEKLLIFDFMQGGSVAAFIHARGPETPLTWETRMSILVEAARGLVHLHEEEKTVHGNLTASNILMDGHLKVKLSDFGLWRLMTQAANSTVIATAGALGYRAPELTMLRKATTKCDVYSFGIVMLELLTGKAPGEGSSTMPGFPVADDHRPTIDLPYWVDSIVGQQWNYEIFDSELRIHGLPHLEEELDAVLQLAKACVKLQPRDRPDMSSVLAQLLQIRSDPA